MRLPRNMIPSTAPLCLFRTSSNAFFTFFETIIGRSRSQQRMSRMKFVISLLATVLTACNVGATPIKMTRLMAVRQGSGKPFYSFTDMLGVYQRGRVSGADNLCPKALMYTSVSPPDHNRTFSYRMPHNTIFADGAKCASFPGPFTAVYSFVERPEFIPGNLKRSLAEVPLIHVLQQNFSSPSLIADGSRAYFGFDTNRKVCGNFTFPPNVLVAFFASKNVIELPQLGFLNAGMKHHVVVIRNGTHITAACAYKAPLAYYSGKPVPQQFSNPSPSPSRTASSTPTASVTPTTSASSTQVVTPTASPSASVSSSPSASSSTSGAAPTPGILVAKQGPASSSAGAISSMVASAGASPSANASDAFAVAIAPVVGNSPANPTPTTARPPATTGTASSPSTSANASAVAIAPVVGNSSATPTPTTALPPATTGTAPSPSTSSSPSASPSGFPSNSTAAAPAAAGSAASPASACFPGSGVVELRGGAHVTMEELEIGDEVRVSRDSFSRVYMFTHRVRRGRFPFVRVALASGGSLVLSAGHETYVNGERTVAGAVRAGDVLEAADGVKSHVARVSSVIKRGLYNPQTVHGDIIVDGIRSTTFTEAVPMPAAQAALAPLRVLYNMAAVSVAALERGIDGLPYLL